MAYRKNHDDDRFEIDIDNDYLELTDSDDEYEDIYSFFQEDVYSDSSKDVYIGKRRREEREDIYIGNRRASQNDIPFQKRTSKHYDTNEFDAFFTSSEYEERPQKRVRDFDSDEISDFEARHGKKQKKKRHGKGFVFIAVLLAIVIGLGAFVSTTVSSVVGQFKKAEPIEHIENVASLVSEAHVRNILLIGTDNAKGGTARSDSIMIASVNKETGRITIISILRDTHLDIPGHRESKVNAAYSWGGANLLIQTIEQNFGIKIDDYATVDFKMFTALIDGLGGIDIEVTEKEANYINYRHKYGKEKKPEKVPSGENVHLSGYQALWYSRIRKLDSDFMRTKRQRKVISAIMTGVKNRITPAGVFELVEIAGNVAPYIETTLSVNDFWSLMFSMVSCFSKNQGDTDKMLVSEKLPFDNTWSYSREWDGSSISINKKENKELLYELLYGESAQEEATVNKK